MITKYTEYIKENNSDSQFFKTYNEIEEWLDLMNIEKYTINHDLTVDVDGNVDLANKNLTYIPVKFGRVKGEFDCYKNKLTSLIGSPEKVDYDFVCSANPLTSLIGSPKKVSGEFFCNNIKFISLDGYTIYNLEKNIDRNWYEDLKPTVKEEYFDKMLEDNPEIISLINFETSTIFKTKWTHLFNANKFDLI